MNLFGYARVSTSGQTFDAELEQLKKAHECLGHGDTLVVTKLDRLARSTRDLLDN